MPNFAFLAVRAAVATTFAALGLAAPAGAHSIKEMASPRGGIVAPIVGTAGAIDITRTIFVGLSPDCATCAVPFLASAEDMRGARTLEVGVFV